MKTMASKIAQAAFASTMIADTSPVFSNEKDPIMEALEAELRRSAAPALVESPIPEERNLLPCVLGGGGVALAILGIAVSRAKSSSRRGRSGGGSGRFWETIGDVFDGFGDGTGGGGDGGFGDVSSAQKAHRTAPGIPPILMPAGKYRKSPSGIDNRTGV